MSFCNPPRLALGIEMLLWQGFPIHKIPVAALDAASDRFLADLAGNAFPSTCFATILVVLLMTLPWADEGDLDEPPFRNFAFASSTFTLEHILVRIEAHVRQHVGEGDRLLHGLYRRRRSAPSWHLLLSVSKTLEEGI